jgi:hypothetical protein
MLEVEASAQTVDRASGKVPKPHLYLLAPIVFVFEFYIVEPPFTDVFLRLKLDSILDGDLTQLKINQLQRLVGVPLDI